MNGTTRGAAGPRCRPGWSKQTLSYMDETGSQDSVLQGQFETGGLWQGAGSYVADNGLGYIVASIGGHLMRVRLSDMAVTDITAPLNDYNSAVRPLSYFCQAENFLVIQNAHEQPFIYNGATLRRAVPPAIGGNDIPIGSVMEYNKGRIWVANSDGTAFAAGDLAYSISGERKDVLSFTENQFLTGGGSFSVPAQAGRITAMRSLAVQDTSTGQGPLQVCTSKGAFSVDAPFDREQWQTVNNPIQTISLLSAGPVSQAASVVINGDMWFRSNDGMRSLMVARREQGTWTNTPLSRENERALNYDTNILLDYASAVLFDNRLICTVGPELNYNDDREIRGVTHRGFAVLDFAPVSQMLNSTQPVWEGLWTGLDILQILTVEDRGTTRCFIFSLNSEKEIELWEMSKNAYDDYDGTAYAPITWAFETPAYPFGDGGWNLRKLDYGDIWFSNLAGDEITAAVRYRCDSDPTWRTWKENIQICAPIRLCSIEDCFPTFRKEQYRPRMRLPKPAQDCDSITKKPVNMGYRFAARFEISGSCRVSQFRLSARDEVEPSTGGCPAETCETSTAIEDSCLVNDYEYSIEETVEAL